MKRIIISSIILLIGLVAYAQPSGPLLNGNGNILTGPSDPSAMPLTGGSQVYQNLTTGTLFTWDGVAWNEVSGVQSKDSISIELLADTAMVVVGSRDLDGVINETSRDTVQLGSRDDAGFLGIVNNETELNALGPVEKDIIYVPEDFLVGGLITFGAGDWYYDGTSWQIIKLKEVEDMTSVCYKDATDTTKKYFVETYQDNSERAFLNVSPYTEEDIASGVPTEWVLCDYELKELKDTTIANVQNLGAGQRPINSQFTFTTGDQTQYLIKVGIDSYTGATGAFLIIGTTSSPDFGSNDLFDGAGDRMNATSGLTRDTMITLPANTLVYVTPSCGGSSSATNFQTVISAYCPSVDGVDEEDAIEIDLSNTFELPTAVDGDVHHLSVSALPITISTGGDPLTGDTDYSVAQVNDIYTAVPQNIEQYTVTGTPVNYTQPNNAPSTVSVILDAGVVELTRANSGSFYNTVTQAGHASHVADDIEWFGDGGGSPTFPSLGTESTMTSMADVTNSGLSNIASTGPWYARQISTGRIWEFDFASWQNSNGGGYSVTVTELTQVTTLGWNIQRNGDELISSQSDNALSRVGDGLFVAEVRESHTMSTFNDVNLGDPLEITLINGIQSITFQDPGPTYASYTSSSLTKPDENGGPVYLCFSVHRTGLPTQEDVAIRYQTNFTAMYEEFLFNPSTGATSVAAGTGGATNPIVHKAEILSDRINYTVQFNEIPGGLSHSWRIRPAGNTNINAGGAVYFFDNFEAKTSFSPTQVAQDSMWLINDTLFHRGSDGLLDTTIIKDDVCGINEFINGPIGISELYLVFSKERDAETFTCNVNGVPLTYENLLGGSTDNGGGVLAMPTTANQNYSTRANSVEFIKECGDYFEITPSPTNQFATLNFGITTDKSQQAETDGSILRVSLPRNAHNLIDEQGNVLVTGASSNGTWRFTRTLYGIEVTRNGVVIHTPAEDCNDYDDSGSTALEQLSVFVGTEWDNAVLGSAWQKMQFSGTPTIDTYNNWDDTNDQYVVSKGGAYDVSLVLQYQNNGSTSNDPVEVAVHVNGIPSELYADHDISDQIDATSGMEFTLKGVLNLSVGDIITCEVFDADDVTTLRPGSNLTILELPTSSVVMPDALEVEDVEDVLYATTSLSNGNSDVLDNGLTWQQAKDKYETIKFYLYYPTSDYHYAPSEMRTASMVATGNDASLSLGASTVVFVQGIDLIDGEFSLNSGATYELTIVGVKSQKTVINDNIVEIDTTGIAGGDALVWNATTDQLEPGTVSSSTYTEDRVMALSGEVTLATGVWGAPSSMNFTVTENGDYSITLYPRAPITSAQSDNIIQWRIFNITDNVVVTQNNPQVGLWNSILFRGDNVLNESPAMLGIAHDVPLVTGKTYAAQLMCSKSQILYGIGGGSTLDWVRVVKED